MEPYDSIGRMMNRKERETRESAASDADYAFGRALQRVLLRQRGKRGSKAAIQALYALETEFHKEMGIEE